MKDFLKMFFASLLSLVVVCGGLLILFSLAVAVLSAGQEKAPRASQAILVVDLSVPISDKPANRGPEAVFRDALAGGHGANLTLYAVTEALKAAAKDDEIKGLFLTGGVARDGYSSGWAALKEVREALAFFKRSNKPILAYDMAYDEAAYYLATMADPLVVHPFGMMELNGFASEMPFFAKAFEKYGVEVQVTRVGKYKSAVEPYLLEKMSDANREQILSFLGDMWLVFLQSAAEARGLSVAEFQRLADADGLLTAPEMLSGKLVDKLAYFDEVQAELKKIAGNDPSDKTFNQIELADYIESRKADFPHGEETEQKIAVLYAEGEIVDGEDHVQVGGDTLGRLLRQARLDDEVKAVVLRVNSPGGSATASEVIQREVRLTSKEKPVIVSMGTVAASGGYWISTYGDRIFAEPNTITGSIGVFGMFPNLQKLVNNIGVNFDTVKTARRADMNSLFRSKNEEELGVYQRLVDQIYESFVGKVVEARKLSREHVLEIAQGRVWSGTDAKELGLVDELGGLEKALDYAAKRAKLGDEWSLAFYQEKKKPFQEFFESLAGRKEERSRSNLLLQQAGRVAAELERLGTINDPRGIYARMPFDLSPR